MPSQHVGRSTPRREDARLVAGAAGFTDALAAEGALHLAVARSPIAHARLARVDVRAARQQAGVVGAWNADDLAGAWAHPLPATGPDGVYVPERWPLAAGKVRHVGDPIAVVAAETREAAVDALEAVDVDYEPLPAVIDPTAAARDETLVHDEAGTNVAFRYRGRQVGDVDAAFASADVVIERRYASQRLAPTSVEPRTTLAVPEPTGGLTVYTSTQVPHRIRDLLAHMLDLDAETVRVVSTDVGGAFGAKLECYPEDLLCAALARRLARPVRFTGTRSEELATTNHGRGQVADVAAAARADGTLLGLRVHVTADCGAYLSRNGANVHVNGDAVFPGCYRWPTYAFTATGLFTNATPTGAYRGAGRPEAAFGVERVLDDLAATLGLDPAEVRRRNLPAPEDFPFDSVGGLRYDSGDYERALDTALKALDYPRVRAEQARRRERGDALLLGVGLSCFIDRCGPGPKMPEHAAVTVDERGRVTVHTGLGPSGQGTATTLAQLTADALGVDPGAVDVVHGDTAVVPHGTGTFGSRSMPVGANAVHAAAREVAERARRVAAHVLEAAVDDVVTVDGGFAVRGSPTSAVALSDLAAFAAGSEAPVGLDGGLHASVRYTPEGLTFPFGAHAAVVEVDRETGQVHVDRYVAVDDAGAVVNPAVLDGQRHGGIAQGIAQALYEGVGYDADGNLVTGTLVDYLVPTAPDLPALELHRTVTPSPNNPLGVKGAGELGTIGAPPAIVNAVVDALRHLGVDEVTPPCSPQAVWRAIAEARG